MVAKEYSLKELRSRKEPDKLLFPSHLSITDGSTPMAPKASPLSYKETMRIIRGVLGFAVLILERLLDFLKIYNMQNVKYKMQLADLVHIL